jgi:hypothetical protein
MEASFQSSRGPVNFRLGPEFLPFGSTVTALGTCAKDMIEMSRQIKDSIDKVTLILCLQHPRPNIFQASHNRRLHNLIDDLISESTSLESCFQGRETVPDGPEDLVSSLDELRTWVTKLLPV